MALWWCAGCSAAFAVGLSACPQCGSTSHTEEEPMPKITVHGGPSNDADPGRAEWIGEAGPELLDVPDGATVLPTAEEEPSPGNSSETSSPKPASSPKQSGSKGRSRARTTANPSGQAPTDSSTARGTDGGQTTDGGEG